MKLARKLRLLRINAELSQRALAIKANIDRGTVRGAESGAKPDDVTLGKLAKALDVDIEELV